MSSYIDNWIVCVTGFTQNEGRITGLERLQTYLHERCHGRRTRVVLKHWKDCMECLSNRIYNNLPPLEHGSPRITLIGYSYGGCSVIRLCNYLRKCNIRVTNLLLVDPVWRLWNIPTPLSLLNVWTFTIPKNVKNVWYWRQNFNKPSGHSIKLESRVTHWRNEGQLPLNEPHSAMDELLEVHKVALDVSCPTKDNNHAKRAIDDMYLSDVALTSERLRDIGTA